jgi:dephospho-CoA kinase
VLDLFRAASWRTADADAVCRGLYDDPVGDFAAACRERWGDAFFTGGRFDRKKIADVVFSRPEELRKLTELMYPHLTRELEAFAAAARKDGADAAVEVPLLYENGMEKHFDAVLTVWAPAELRHRRLREFRHFDDAEIRRREALQMDADEKLERADYALVNSGDAAELKAELDILLERLEKRRNSGSTK